MLFKNSNKEFGIVFLAASSMLFLKLCLSGSVYGSNDITYWIIFARIIEQFGTFKIYSMVNIYNHPPLMSWILRLIILVHRHTQLSFPYLFRLMPIIADFFSVLVIWELLKKYGVKNKVLICLICVLNPINFLISGFHGNTDPLFIFFILLAIYLIEEKKIALAGSVYGLSICIKIVPLILVPLFFYFLKIKEQRERFFIYSFLVPLIVFFPYLIYDYHSVLRNIFSYSGLVGIWGVSHFFNCIYYLAFFKVFFLIVEVVLLKSLITSQRSNLLDLSFLSFCLFLAITPGFGVQYLSWLSYFAIIIFPILGSIYVLLGGFFLYRVYVFWGGGYAPYYANSLTVGQWGGLNLVLDISLWLLIVTMLIKFLIDRKVFSHAILRQ